MLTDPDLWNVFVVDDEPELHAAVEAALRERSWKGRGFKVIGVRSAAEARDVLIGGDTGFRVAIVDVMFEAGRAGLSLCQFIREHCAPTLRIVLMSGQPEHVPEASVLQNYDIDSYLLRDEASGERIFALVRACLRGAEDILALEEENAALVGRQNELVRANTTQAEFIASLGDAKHGLLGKLLAQVRALKEPTARPEAADALQKTAEQLSQALQSSQVGRAVQAAVDECLIFVVFKERKARQKLVGALVGTGARVEAFEEPGAMLERLGREPAQILFTDWTGAETVKEAVNKCPELRVVLIVAKPLFEQHGSTIMRLPLSNLLISTLGEDAEAKDPLAFHELVVTTGKLLTGDVFGLEKYLAWGTRIREERLTSSVKRADIVDAIGTYATECGLRGTTCTRIKTLADELMMNAIWDAPVDAAGKAKYAHLTRMQPLELLPEEAVTVRYGSDGNLFGVCVSDRFGRLQSELAFGYLLKCFRRGPDQIDSKQGGAGLGLYMAYLAVSTFVINVQPRKKTEAIGLLNMHLSHRDLQERARSFQYFLGSSGTT